MAEFLEALLVFGLCGFILIGGVGAGVFILFVSFFNKNLGKKLQGMFQNLMGIFGLIGCVTLYFLFYT
ncbi:MAG: hypothetical protein CFH08_01665 [Alphaproteobacteria bacterium MarineAlpha3_Bin7]|nr:MAG: hypothetical protein CFH08_01665 [Alphaproteobacteria bacterium MarineAlpha3_Bin7]|tara:strand:- start:755 stop:958 length:204 start_codon:yes stop_codon:yes gene_type:complete